jgi:hypothetical protein
VLVLMMLMTVLVMTVSVDVLMDADVLVDDADDCLVMTVMC